MHETIYPETQIERSENLGKKSSVKSAKKLFLYSHEYRDQKIGTKKCKKQFFQKNTKSARNNVGKKSSEKSAKKSFLYSHEYRVQKMRGKKCAKQIFQIHMNSARKNVGKKSE